MCATSISETNKSHSNYVADYSDGDKTEMIECWCGTRSRCRRNECRCVLAHIYCLCPFTSTISRNFVPIFTTYSCFSFGFLRTLSRSTSSRSQHTSRWHLQQQICYGSQSIRTCNNNPTSHIRTCNMNTLSAANNHGNNGNNSNNRGVQNAAATQTLTLRCVFYCLQL